MKQKGAGDSRQALAVEGEQAAARFLRQAGMRMLEARYRCRAGEIDLILDDGGVLVFVEVKTRSGTGFGRPWEAVDRRKIARIARVASWYLAVKRQDHRTCRFDVVEVLGPCPERFRIRHIRDAFRLGDCI